MQPDLEWRAIAGFPGYEVSSGGEVRSYYLPGHRILGEEPRILLPAIKRHGYQEVTLCDGHRHTSHRVHVLVLEAFRERRPSNKVARHLNGNRINNHLTNLVWGTHDDNERDKLKHGTLYRGSRHPRAKITESDVLKMKALRTQGMLLKDIGARFDVSPDCVSSIMHGRTWQHVQPGAT